MNIRKQIINGEKIKIFKTIKGNDIKNANPVIMDKKW